MAIRTKTIISTLAGIKKKRTPQSTITIKNLPPETKPSVTFVDIGKQAPEGYEFVDSSGKSLGSTVDRVGGYTVVGRVAGGSGGRIVSGSESGEVTPMIAYTAEGGKTFESGAGQVTNKTATLSPEIQQQVVRQQRLQKIAETQRVTSQKQKEYVQTQKPKEVYLSPYVTREDPVITGYTASGKPIYGKGKAVVVNPFAEQEGATKARPATPIEITQLESEETKQGITGIPKVSYNPEDLYSYKELVSQGAFSSIVRKGAYDFGNLALFQYPLYKLGITKTPAAQAQARSIIGEGALFGFFSPAFKIRTDVLKTNYPFTTKVKAVGVTQQIQGNQIKTDIYYQGQVGQGGKLAGISVKPPTFKGVSTTYTKFANLNQAQIYKSITKGASISKGIEFPTGRLVTKFSNKYKGFEFGIGKGQPINENLFFSQQQGVGKIISKGKSIPFKERSMGYSFEGLNKGTKTYLTFTSSGDSMLFKNLPNVKKFTLVYGKSITGQQTILSKEVLKELQPVVETNVNFIPKTIIKGKSIMFPTGKLITGTPTRTVILETITPSQVPKFASVAKISAVQITKAGAITAIETGTKSFVPTITSSVSMKNLVSTKTVSVSQGKFLIIPKQKEILKEGTIAKIKVEQINIPQEREKTRSASSSMTILKEETQQREVQKLQIKQIPLLKQKQIIKISPRVNPNPFGKTTNKIPPFRLSSYSQPKQTRGSFLVSVRRFGKFKPIAKTSTIKQAFDIGKFKTRTTLGATFKVEGTKQQPSKLFGYKTKKTKLGTLFIEEPKFRLSTPTEKAEIQFFKRMKGGRK